MKEYVEYNGSKIEVRRGAWLDVMNSCFYTEVDKIKNFDICRENKYDKDGNLIGEYFALPHYGNI